MRFVTSLSIDRQPRDGLPFWPAGVRQLVLVVWRPDDADDQLRVYGIDPDHRRVVFQVQIPSAQQGAFVQAVIDGARAISADPIVVALGSSGDEGQVVVIPDKGPDVPGPKGVSIEIAVTTAGARATANAALRYD